MIFNLINSRLPFLEEHHLGFLRVFTYVEFRAVASILTAFLIVILFGKRTIRSLLRLKIGDSPEFYNKTLNELTKSKANTPTMGGVLISVAILVTTALLADLHSFYVHMAMLCLVWLAALGAFDDYLKLTAARRGAGRREGLFFWEKAIFQLGLAVLLGLFIHNYGGSGRVLDEFRDMSHSLNLPFLKTWDWDAQLKQWTPSVHLIVLSAGWFVLLTVLVVAGSSNAVNLTDGMDGLASGITTVVAFAFMILALLAGWGRGEAAKQLLVPYIPGSAELAVVAGAMVGACLAFLWFNCHPAQVFMGDTGSLPLGGLIGFIAVVIRQEFLLLVIGGVFVAEALSVILQVGYFKASHGKRIFKCAPLHHHFHLSGWTEQQVVVRFWIASIVLAAIALATIKVR